jgi:hypothetical protein
MTQSGHCPSRETPFQLVGFDGDDAQL